jgi:hypothetical protein
MIDPVLGKEARKTPRKSAARRYFARQ